MANLSLCFVQYKDSYLLINRNKPPFMGMWNAVGGHQEKNETIFECAIREIYEETNIHVNTVELMGTFTWNFDNDIGYIFVAKLNEDFNIDKYPLKNNEGLVDFKKIEWILNPQNTGIIEDLVIFIHEISNNKKNVYHFIYDIHNKLQSYTKKDYQG